MTAFACVYEPTAAPLWLLKWQRSVDVNTNWNVSIVRAEGGVVDNVREARLASSGHTLGYDRH
jgi:hypothetical protein